MKLDYVREFLTLAQTCNYLEAADRLFLSQSTLSRHMQSLEAELGIELFERTTRRVKLGDGGRLFLPYAEEMVRIVDECTDDFAERLRQMTAVLTIGSIPSMSQYNITALLSDFQRETPNLTVEIVEADTNALRQMVREGTCDFAFIRDTGEEHKDLSALDYEVDWLAAVLPVGHPLAKEPSIRLEQLKDEKFYLLPEDTMLYQMCMASCKKTGFFPKVAYTSYRGRNLINYVGKGHGVSILFKRSAMYYANPNVSILDIEPKIEIKIKIIYGKSKNLTMAQSYFLRYLKQTKADSRKA